MQTIDLRTLCLQIFLISFQLIICGHQYANIRDPLHRRETNSCGILVHWAVSANRPRCVAMTASRSMELPGKSENENQIDRPDSGWHKKYVLVLINLLVTILALSWFSVYFSQ